MELKIYTDGAALGNPGKGGYGIVLLWNGISKEISAAYRLTTNNRMELLAVIVALEAIKKTGITIHIYTDSKYVHDAIEKKWVWNWQKNNWKGKKNKDLWLRFLKIYEKHTIVMHWVKGHNGDTYNELCDQLATSAAKNGPWLTDSDYESSNSNNTLI